MKCYKVDAPIIDIVDLYFSITKQLQTNAVKKNTSIKLKLSTIRNKKILSIISFIFFQNYLQTQLPIKTIRYDFVAIIGTSVLWIVKLFSVVLNNRRKRRMFIVGYNETLII